MRRVPDSNDQLRPQPKIPAVAQRLEFDFPGLKIGCAEYEEGPTGCTVFLLDRGWTTAIDKRGGMVGVCGDYDWNHAICFAGGSLLGLEAASGVVAELFAAKGHSTNNMPLVSGAIIWDYVNRSNTVFPDRELGRAATASAASGSVPVGRVGAGRSATVGKFRYPAEPGGQGAAFREFAGVKLLVVTVLNAVGCVVDRDGRAVRGHLNPRTGERLRPAQIIERTVSAAAASNPNEPTRNTTLTLLATDAKLTAQQLQQLGRQVHTSMSRCIDPFHTSTDGDVLFAVTSNQVELSQPVSPDVLGVVASEVAWDAVLAAVAD
jgi:L-aminopeptidase/D-esterase-like protein